MKAILTLMLAFTVVAAADTKLGKPLALKEAVAIEKVAAAPDTYVGKTIQVKGKATDVCTKMGCWIQLADATGKKTVRIKVEDGVIVFPKEALGKTVVAEGKFAKIVMTKEQAIEQAKHEAEANGKKFDPKSITEGKTVYQIDGTGAVVLD